MRTVHELNQDELEELRESYFCEIEEANGGVTSISVNEIPMEDVINHYDGIHFVEDDFFCNL